MSGIRDVGGTQGNYGWEPKSGLSEALDELGKMFQDAVSSHDKTGQWNLYQLFDMINRLQALKDDPNLTPDQKNDIENALNGFENLIRLNSEAYDIKKQMDELIKQGKEDSPEFAELESQLVRREEQLMQTQMGLQFTMTHLCNLPMEPLRPS